MIEAGVVIDIAGRPVFWHMPENRTGVSLPDSRTLWDVLWDEFKGGTLQGFAHSHPGAGVPGPSYTDVTTFAAIEDALGKRLTWWITSETHVVELHWGLRDETARFYAAKDTSRLTYSATIVQEAPSWVEQLRRLSK